MKQFLLFAATVLVTLGTISQAQAKKPEDQEFRRVIVTLTSGEKVDGYLQRSWHAEYVEKTEAHPDGIRWEALDIASPGLKDRYRTFRRLVCLNKASQNATTYWWKIWTTERVGNIDRRVLKTVYGIRFHDDPDRTVYPYMLVNTMLVEKQHPGLQKFCKTWFKGSEGKVRKKEAKENDAWMLDMYDAYLAAQADK